MSIRYFCVSQLLVNTYFFILPFSKTRTLNTYNRCTEPQQNCHGRTDLTEHQQWLNSHCSRDTTTIRGSYGRTAINPQQDSCEGWLKHNSRDKTPQNSKVKSKRADTQYNQETTVMTRLHDRETGTCEDSCE